MALINDPDQLSQGTEVIINKIDRTIALAIAGNLTADGVTMQALYSFLKEEWKSDTSLIKYTFPMLAITPEQFEIGNNGSKYSDWKLADETTKKLIRTGGWREYDSTGSTLAEYTGVITLGNIDALDKDSGDRAYYFFDGDSSVAEFVYAGAVNEAIQTYGNASNGGFDKRSLVLNLRLRQGAKTYGASTSKEIGVNTITYKVERFPLSESADGSVSFTDNQIDSAGNGTADQAPFAGMSIEYFDTEQNTTVGSTPYDYKVRVNGNGGTKEQIYAFVQWKLRQNADIDDGVGTVLGLQAEDLVKLEGGTLKSLLQSNGSAVFIDNFDAIDTNSVSYKDKNGNTVNYPYVAVGKLVFNTNLVSDTAAQYWLFFENANGKKVDTDDAILVKDNNDNDITGAIEGNQEITFSFDYDGNAQGGRTPSTDASVILRAMGLSSGQFVQAKYTLQRSIGMSFPAVAPLERNYVNV